MKVIGEYKGEPVGCWCVLRSNDRPSHPPVPVYTIHRVTRVIALGVARSIHKASSPPCDYYVAPLETECDCHGRMDLGPYEIAARRRPSAGLLK